MKTFTFEIKRAVVLGVAFTLAMFPMSLTASAAGIAVVDPGTVLASAYGTGSGTGENSECGEEEKEKLKTLFSTTTTANGIQIADFEEPGKDGKKVAVDIEDPVDDFGRANRDDPPVDRDQPPVVQGQTAPVDTGNITNTPGTEPNPCKPGRTSSGAATSVTPSVTTPATEQKLTEPK